MNTSIKNNTITFSCLAAIVLLPCYLYFKNNRFFFIDDKVAEYFPKLIDIARILKSGELPFLSTNLVNGGMYAVEFQEGVFNPFVLLGALLLESFDNLALGACVLTIYYLLIAFGGYYLLAVGFGLRRGWANIFALSISLNCFLIYWFAASWFNPMYAAAFLPYSLWSALVLMKKITAKTSIVFLLSCYLTVSAGWPATLLAMTAFMVLLLCDILFVQKNITNFIRNSLIYIGAALVCTIPVLPLLSSSEMFTRMSKFENNANFVTGSLQGLLMFSFPAFKDFIHVWGGYTKMAFSTYYAAWFVLPLLVFLNFKTINIWKRQFWMLICLTVVFGVAILGPEQMGSLRFPIRMLQFYHIFGVLLILSLAEVYGFTLTEKRLSWAIACFALQAIFAFQVNPENISIICYYFIALLILTSGIFFLLKKKDGFEVVIPWVLAGTIALLVSIYGTDFHGRGSDWNVPAVRSEYSSLGKAGTGYVMFNGAYLNTQQEHQEFRPATTGLIWNDKIINGYSPLGNKLLRKKIVISDQGNIMSWMMKNKGREFFEVDETTGLELVELMKVNRIISLKGKWGASLNAAVSDRWQVIQKQGTFIYDHKSYDYPGLISWLDTDMEIVEIVKQQHSKEQYVIKNRNVSTGRIVFARQWWPGYKASINGKDIPVEKYADFLISVSVPGETEGVLSLSFVPPGLRLGLLLSIIGLMLIFIVNVFVYKSNRTPKTQIA